MLDTHPESLKFRLIKIRTMEGKWRDFHNVKDLQTEVIDRYHPRDVYMGVTQWLNSSNLRRDWAHKHAIIDSEFWIEVDNEDFPDPADAQKEILKVWAYLERVPWITFEKAGFSGWGFYLIYHSPQVRMAVQRFHSIEARFEYWKATKQALVESLVKEGFRIDYKLTKTGRVVSPCADIFRVRRVLGTFNGKRGTMSKEFKNITELERFHLPKISLVGNKVGEAATAEKQPHGSGLLLTNQIPGTKAFVFHAIITKREQLKALTPYNVGPLWVRQVGKGYDVVGINKIEYTRLCKALKACKATNYKSFQKYQISGITAYTEDTQMPYPILVDFIPSTIGKFTSRIHCDYLNKVYRQDLQGNIGNFNMRLPMIKVKQ